MADRDYTELYASLQKETTILTAQIRALYRELDKKYHLRGAQIPITFGFETDALGSYTRAGHHEKEHFHFSLLFVGYGVKNPLSKEDRMDLYKHEYAHYMEHHITIPREYQWQPGLHGSAWKYCCSLVGAAPTPYFVVSTRRYRIALAFAPLEDSIITKFFRPMVKGRIACSI